MTTLPIPSYPWIVQQPVGLGTDKLKSTINIIIEIKEIISISIPQLEPRIKFGYKILEKNNQILFWISRFTIFLRKTTNNEKNKFTHIFFIYFYCFFFTDKKTGKTDYLDMEW
jgi:hypothetical protein